MKIVHLWIKHRLIIIKELTMTDCPVETVLRKIENAFLASSFSFRRSTGSWWVCIWSTMVYKALWWTKSEAYLYDGIIMWVQVRPASAWFVQPNDGWPGNHCHMLIMIRMATHVSWCVMYPQNLCELQMSRHYHANESISTSLQCLTASILNLVCTCKCIRKCTGSKAQAGEWTGYWYRN